MIEQLYYHYPMSINIIESSETHKNVYITKTLKGTTVQLTVNLINTAFGLSLLSFPHYEKRITIKAVMEKARCLSCLVQFFLYAFIYCKTTLLQRQLAGRFH